jgi:hypothetical protein
MKCKSISFNYGQACCLQIFLFHFIYAADYKKSNGGRNVFNDILFKIKFAYIIIGLRMSTCYSLEQVFNAFNESTIFKLILVGQPAMLRFRSASLFVFKMAINYSPNVTLSRHRLEREATLAMDGYISSSLLAVHPKYLN